MEEEKEWTLETIVYEFCQEGNTNGTTEEEEKLTVTIEAAAVGLEKEGGFFVIRTNGWSFDSIEEFNDMLSIIKNGITSEK